MLQHRPLRLQPGILRQVVDAHAAPHGNRAGVRAIQAGDHAQQGGLAAAVQADQADAVAAVDQQVDLVQQHALAKLLGDVLQRDQVHGWSLIEPDHRFLRVEPAQESICR